MPGPPADVEDLATPLLQVPVLFGASQASLASHRKHINSLHLIFLKCVSVSAISADGKSMRLTGEKAFGEAFRQAVVYPLGVKKGVEQGDRVIKFVAGFVAFAVEYDAKLKAAEEEEEDEDEDDGPASRLVAQLLSFLLKGFEAKNKVARFRCVQLVALMVNSLTHIDDDSYQHLKNALLDRVRDKESSVRMQAVVALSKLQTADDDIESDDDDTEQEAQRVTDVLIDVLSHDPAAEVRRAALFNLIPSPITLPALMLRTLDVDPINRRAAFAHVLSEFPCMALTQAQREEAIGRGLRDREEGVKKAAKRLACKWVEDPRVGGLVNFVKLFDLYEGVIAEKALDALFELKPELIDEFDLSDAFYESLTPHSAFIARTYFSHLRELEDPRLADLEPVVTALAYYIQAEWIKLSVVLESEEKDEDVSAALEFVVGELVGIAVNVDYGDEIGRRKMFELMREMLSHSSLPAGLIPRCLDVLLKGTSERDFMRIVVEIVQELRAESTLITSDEGEQADDEELDEFEARKEAAKGKRAVVRGASPSYFGKRKELDLRCLLVVRAMLERVMGNNSMVHGLVLELIVPAVVTKDIEVRAAGLICLGLGCLLDKKMAVDSFELLARQSQATEGILQVKLLQTLFDILVLHGIHFGEDRNAADGPSFSGDVILGFLMSSLEQEEADAVATSVVGIAKLVLSGMVTDEEIISRLVLLYFASETIDNQELRQCLSYFFPVYCYSNPQNQRRVSNILLSTLSLLKGVYDDLGDKAIMVAPLQIGAQLIDWTDPQKSIRHDRVKTDEAIHFDLALRMTKQLYQEEQKDERKLICQLLPKLYISEDVEDFKVKALLSLIASLNLNRPLADAVSKNALARFEKSLSKTFGERIKALGKEDISASMEMKDIKEFLEQILNDDEIFEEEEEEEEGEGANAGSDEEEEEAEDEENDDDAAEEEIEQQTEVVEESEEEE